MSITVEGLIAKLQSNRTGPTRKTIVMDALFDELPKRKCLGGEVHGTYADFRKVVLDTAMANEVLQMSAQVAALNFNNLRKESENIIAVMGGLEINGKVYEDAQMRRDPGQKKASGARIPDGKWFVVNKSTKRVAEDVSNKKSALKICNHTTQVVISREEYIQSWI